MISIIDVPIELLPHTCGMPVYMTRGAAGLDLQAALNVDEFILEPFARALVPCGFKIAIPDGYEAQVRPRSGLAWKFGITCANSPGTIDSDYRGEIHAMLVNLSNQPQLITRGQRIAQLVFAPVAQAQLKLGEPLDTTQRGEGGFGSTGA